MRVYWRAGLIPTGRRRDEGGVRAVSRWILLAIRRCAENQAGESHQPRDGRRSIKSTYALT